MKAHEGSSEASDAGGAQEADHFGKAYDHFRKVAVRNMIARGQAPPGYRINDDRTGFVRVGNPAWPVRPLDPHCTQYGEPSLELAALIRKFLPDFDPDADRRGWLEVAEFVLRTRRPAADVQAMVNDELIAFFRHELFHRQRSSAEVELTFPATANPTPSSTTVTSGAAAIDDTTPEKTTSELLHEWLGDPARRPKLVATLSAERAGMLIGRSASSVREAGDAWKKLKKEFKAYRTYRRLE